MEILTPKATRRFTRLRVEMPVIVTSMDRRHAFSDECTTLVISPQGCGLRCSQGLPLETPVLLSHLPGGGTATGRVANCLPLGHDGKFFLIGIALYNPANVWGISNPPADWDCEVTSQLAAKETRAPAGQNVWPYNLFSGHGESRPGQK